MRVIVEFYDKDNSGKCQLVVESDEYDTKVSFEQTGLYFTPVAIVTSDARMASEKSVLVSTSAKSACGEYGGVFGYEKTLAVDGKRVQIRETFRCALEGFKKYDLSTTCQF